MIKMKLETLRNLSVLAAIAAGSVGVASEAQAQVCGSSSDITIGEWHGSGGCEWCSSSECYTAYCNEGGFFIAGSCS